jgi:hypothetical protein
MIDHLSSEQVSRFIAGDGTAEETKHASGCAACATEIERLREVFSVFHDSAQEWMQQSGGSHLPSPTRAGDEPRRFSLYPLRWAFALALAVLVAIPIYKTVTEPRADDANDAQLLEEINAHLSRTVPAPMEPLMELLSESTADEAGRRSQPAATERGPQ